MAKARFHTFLFILLGGAVIGSISSLMLTQFSVFTVMVLPITLLSLWLMHQTVHIFSIQRMTISGFWYLSYMVMIFIPAFYVANEKLDDPIKFNYLFAVTSVLVTAPLGILVANIIFHFRPAEIKNYFTTSVKKRATSSHLVLAYLIFLAAALALMIFYVVEVRTIPLFYLINNIGAYDQVQNLRETSFKLLNSRLTYAYSALRQVGYPFLIMLALGSYLSTRRSIWLLMFLTVLSSGVLYAAFAVAKSPVATIFLTLFLFVYLYFGGVIKTNWLILGLVFILAFPVGIVFLLQPEAGLLPILRSTAIRLFDDPARQLYSYFEVVPQYIDYLHGTTIGIVARLMGQVPTDLTNYVALYDNPALKEQGLSSASANAAFIGDLHANFGRVGVLAGAFLAGLLMQVMQIYLLRQPKTIANLAVYSFLMFGFWLLNSTALQTALLSGGIIFAFILAGLVKISESFLRDVGTAPYPVQPRVSGL